MIQGLPVQTTRQCIDLEIHGLSIDCCVVGTRLLRQTIRFVLPSIVYCDRHHHLISYLQKCIWKFQNLILGPTIYKAHAPILNCKPCNHTNNCAFEAAVNLVVLQFKPFHKSRGLDFLWWPLALIKQWESWLRHQSHTEQLRVLQINLFLILALKNAYVLYSGLT